MFFGKVRCGEGGEDGKGEIIRLRPGSISKGRM